MCKSHPRFHGYYCGFTHYEVHAKADETARLLSTVVMVTMYILCVVHIEAKEEVEHHA
jgi:hypothetical protein